MKRFLYPVMLQPALTRNYRIRTSIYRYIIKRLFPHSNLDPRSIVLPPVPNQPSGTFPEQGRIQNRRKGMETWGPRLPWSSSMLDLKRNGSDPTLGPWLQYRTSRNNIMLIFLSFITLNAGLRIRIRPIWKLIFKNISGFPWISPWRRRR